jgi:hypothetical protein
MKDAIICIHIDAVKFHHSTTMNFLIEKYLGRGGVYVKKIYSLNIK